MVMLGHLAEAIDKVLTGAGMEHCCRIAGVPFNYFGALALFCGLALVGGAVLILRVREWRLRRSFERKYGVKLPASDSESGGSLRAGSEPLVSGSHHFQGISDD